MAKREYASAEYYERKLARVMDCFRVESYDYNFDRHGCWIQFRLEGELYRFEHSVEKARTFGIELRRGSDAFAQVVLALEDLCRIAERGIYKLSTWVQGMKFLPPPVEAPSFFRFLGFTEIPSGRQEVRERFRTLAKQMHPDVGGDPKDFEALKRAAEQAMAYFGEEGGN